MEIEDKKEQVNQEKMVETDQDKTEDKKLLVTENQDKSEEKEILSGEVKELNKTATEVGVDLKIEQVKDENNVINPVESSQLAEPTKIIDELPVMAEKNIIHTTKKEVESELSVAKDNKKSEILVGVSGSVDSKNIIKELLIKARKSIQQRRQKRLDKIIFILGEQGRLTNKEIRKIIKKSRATVKRYMDILEKEG